MRQSRYKDISRRPTAIVALSSLLIVSTVLPTAHGENTLSDPTRKAYFGDLHVHTQNSFDAFVFGVRRSPDDAYRFAKGEAIPNDGGGQVKLADGPLDFYAVTDHGEYLGIVPAMADPEHPLSKTNTASTAFSSDPVKQSATFARIGASFVTQQPIEDIYDKEHINKTWLDTVDAANRHYEPGSFTTFAGYEFTAMKPVDIKRNAATNLHRNVIFEDQAPDTIFTTLESGDPNDLWRWMDGERTLGRDVLAIPHNANASNGMMFSLYDTDGNPVSREALERRHRNEPVVEINQIKGSSDTRPLFSPEDEWAEFEHYPFLVASKIKSQDLAGSYVRPSLGEGLSAAEHYGVNPFAFGLIGSSDTHIGAGPYDEHRYSGKFPADAANPRNRGSVPLGDTWEQQEALATSRGLRASSAPYFSAGGLAGVWAEANTREALFAALKRKEVFGTSGPRIQVRFFAGNYPDDLLGTHDALTQAYQRGVPMGATLAAGIESPAMLIWALQDPNSEPLQRLQVIKVWRDVDDEHREIVFDVACPRSKAPDPRTHRCPDNGAVVDVKTCQTTSDAAAAELKTLWHDPSYRANQSAVYYVRVLENPSCRWSTWDAVRNGTPPNPDVPTTVQERAWSSPIWLTSKGA